MEDCTPVAQHHFRHPAAARYAGCRIFAHGRPPGPRMVSRSLALLTRVELDHILDGTVPFCYCRMHTKAAQHHLRHRLPCVHRGRLASQPTRAASRRGRARPRGADPCLLELPQATHWSVPCRFGAEQCVRRPNSTTSGIGAYTPIRAARGSRRRVGWALFRLLRGLSMAAPQQARVAGYPARFSRPAPGRWPYFYHAYKQSLS